MSNSLEILADRLQLAGVVYFSAHEIGYLGTTHYISIAKNTPPPLEVLDALVKVAKVADLIRAEAGIPLMVVSGYRSPTYNAWVGGAKRSMHLQGMALDLAPVDGGKIARLKLTAEHLWNVRKIRGGLGLYKPFIHVDVGRYRRW